MAGIAAASKANGTIVTSTAISQTQDIKGGEVGMMNLNDTISAFRCCTQIPPMCKECPLTEMCKWNLSKDRCKNEVKLSVNHWLQAQEPRVMTLEEYDAWTNLPFTERDPVFHEERTERGTVTSWVNTTVCSLCEYGKNDRCWTSRPTEAEREAIPWV